MSKVIHEVEEILKISNSRKIKIRVDEVFVHPHRTKKTYIRGCLFVVESNFELRLVWLPYSLLVEIDPHLCIFLKKNGNLVTDAEFQKMNSENSEKQDSGKFSSGKIDPGLEIDQGTKTVKRYNADELYTMNFVLKNINSLKKISPAIGWSYMIITTNDAQTQPPLFFHDGGCNRFFNDLSKMVTLSKSRMDPNVFILNSLNPPLKNSLKESGLEDYYTDVIDGGKWGLRELGSQFASKVRDIKNAIIGQTRKKKEQRPPSTLEGPKPGNKEDDSGEIIKKPNGEKAKFGFLTENDKENKGECDLEKTEQPPLELSQNLKREEELSLLFQSKWKQQDEFPKGIDVDTIKKNFFDEENGVLKSPHQLFQKIFYCGLTNEARALVWPFLLGLYDINSTEEERLEKDKKYESSYNEIKKQWTSISEEQKANFATYRDRLSKIEKDVVRTDRTFPDYIDLNGPMITKLRNILITYTFYDFDIGYCQGMNDVLSPILTVVRKEYIAFWCMVLIMKTIRKNFSKEMNSMDQKLADLLNVIKVLDYEFFCYLEDVKADNLFFCFRWLLVLFKREFGFNETMRLWDSIFSKHLEISQNVMEFSTPVFIAFAMLKGLRDDIIKDELTNDGIFKLCIEKQMKFDNTQVLKDAEVACMQFLRMSKDNKSKNNV